MRYIIYGAGAIGGTIGGRLFQAGYDVTLICRGKHLEACHRDGLTLRSADESITLRVPAAGHPFEVEWRGDEVVILAMKSQDTQAAIEALRMAAGDVPVVCAQNGVANERMATRIFSRVYGMVVWMPTTHLNPGEVIVHSSPLTGVLDCGRYPAGTDDLIGLLAADLRASGIGSQTDARIMRMKYTKLLMNLNNTLLALCGDASAGEIAKAVRNEALTAYQAAGIDYATMDELQGRHSGVTVKPVPGVDSRLGGSTWQSMMRGGPLETDYLNGEISLLGALHGVPTPANRMLQGVAAEAVREKRRPGDYSVEDLMARLPG